MKRFIALALAALTVLTLTACDTTDTVDNETSDTALTTESVTTEEQIIYNTMNITDFQIVYHDIAEASLANTVKDAFKKKAGVDLPIARDSKTAEYELVVGSADRAITNKFFDTININSDKYGYIVDGKSIYLLGLTDAIVLKSADHFIQTYLGDKATFEIENNTELYIQTDLAALSIPAKPEGDDVIRFVSNNILLQRLLSEVNRAKDIFEAYTVLRPDIVALQETDDIWLNQTNLLGYMKLLGLEVVISDKRVETPILYNTKTLKLIESGFGTFDALEKYGVFRGYQWALFEQLSTGKKFIAISTHFNASAPKGCPISEDSLRSQSATQAAKEVTDLSEKYGVPIVFGGDFNSIPSSSAYSILKVKFNTARSNCTSRTNMEYRTDNPYGKPPEKGNWCIDHVFYSKEGVNALHFETIISNLCYIYSDHVPISFDFTLS